MTTGPDLWLGVGVALTAGLMLVAACARLCRVERSLGPVLLTYVAHVTISMIIFSQVEFLVPDERLYDRLGVTFSDQLSGTDVGDFVFSDSKVGWVYVLGTLYYLLGHAPLVGLILNATAMAMVPIAISNATFDLGWQRAARPALIAACIPPPFLIWGSLLLREAIVLLLISIAFASAAKFGHGRNASAFLVFAASMGGLYFVRGTAALLIGASLAVGAVIMGRRSSSRISIGQGAAILVVVVGAIALLQLGAAYFGWDLDQANVTRAATTRDAVSAIAPGDSAAITSGQGAVTTALITLPTAVLGPFPWQMSFSGVGLLTAPDAVYWWGIAVLAFLGWMRPEAVRGRWLCVVPALMILLTLTLTTGAFGSLVRYRAMALPFLLPLVALGILRIRSRGGGEAGYIREPSEPEPKPRSSVISRS